LAFIFVIFFRKQDEDNKKMKKVFSKVDQSLLCYQLSRSDVTVGRVDLSDAVEILQASAMVLEKGRHVRAHKHLPTKKNTIGTQEAWVVVDGQVLARVYDIDNSFLNEICLESGDLIVFFRGGHELLATKKTIFYELKTGPYLGRENDLEPIS